VVADRATIPPGLDFDHRPLGYEPKTISNFNNLQDAGGPRKTL
jgi:hypothetical protein